VTAHQPAEHPAWLYQGLHGRLQTRRLRVWRDAGGPPGRGRHRDGDGHPGTSITNAAEQVQAHLRAECPYEVVDVIEHYAPRPTPGAAVEGDSDADGVTWDAKQPGRRRRQSA
jgi:hypothetical protein